MTSGGDEFANRYFNLLGGLGARLPRAYELGCAPRHIDEGLRNAVRDLRQDCADGRIKTCIQKQVNLLEAIGRTCPRVTGTTLGAICNQVVSWPHEKLKEAMKDLYNFTSDYPGIRHSGTPANALRAVDMRDMVAMSILLAGLTPYLSNGLNADVVYWGT